MSMPAHIEFAALVEFVEGRTSAEARDRLQAHLSICQTCAAQAAQLAAVTGLMRADQAEDAPRYARANAINMFAARRQPAASTLRRVLAALKFDSLQMTPALGVRGTAASARQLLFTAGDNELHVQVAPDGDRWRVTGQVLGPCTGGEVEARNASATVSAALDELCEFTLPPLAAGQYTLSVRLGHLDLEIPDLNLGEAKA